MTTLLYTHPACLEHDTGYGHPECAARLQAVLDALQAESFSALERRDAPLATLDQLTRIHSNKHVSRVLENIPRHGYYAIDGDTTVSPQSGEAALRAAGAACAAVDAVLNREANNAFCAIRPPGHHAEPDRAMGFCLFNNIAIAATHAREIHHLERIAIIDFDVHHGNGTQSAFERDPHCLYISCHQNHIYPGTGLREERGVENIVNIPLSAGSDTTVLQTVWHQEAEPALQEYQPQLILISAGFDAHYMDPLARLGFNEKDYEWLTRQILNTAEIYCEGRVISMLEGGYNLSALAASVAVHVQVLIEFD